MVGAHALRAQQVGYRLGVQELRAQGCGAQGCGAVECMSCCVLRPLGAPACRVGPDWTVSRGRAGPLDPALRRVHDPGYRSGERVKMRYAARRTRHCAAGLLPCTQWERGQEQADG